MELGVIRRTMNDGQTDSTTTTYRQADKQDGGQADKQDGGQTCSNTTFCPKIAHFPELPDAPRWEPKLEQEAQTDASIIGPCPSQIQKN